ncbi:unnamed protein product [Mortierella alpina]
MTQQSSCLEFRGYGSIIFVHYGSRSATPKAHSSHTYSTSKARALVDHHHHHPDKVKHSHTHTHTHTNAQRTHAQPARDHFHNHHHHHHDTHVISTNTLHTPSPYTQQNHSRRPIEHPYSAHHHVRSNSSRNNLNNHYNHHSHYTDSYNDSSDSSRDSYSPEPEPESRSDARLSTRPSPMPVNGFPTRVPESHRYDAGHRNSKTISPAEGHLKREGAPEDSAVAAPQAVDVADGEETLLQPLSTIDEESLQEQTTVHWNPSREISPPSTIGIRSGTGNIAPTERDAPPPPQMTKAWSSVTLREEPLARTAIGDHAANVGFAIASTQSFSSTPPNSSSSASSPPLPLQKRPRSPSRERGFLSVSPRAKRSPSDDLSPQTSRELSARPSLPQPHRTHTWPTEKHSARLLPSPLESAHSHGPPPVVGKHRRRRISSEEGARILVNGVARFICHECNRYFTRANNLKMHRLTHAGTKPYLCRYEDSAGDPCTSAFTRKHDLQRHVDSVHLMATKFKCSHCGVECKRQDGFRRHQLSNPQCRMANNAAQVLRRRDETTAEAELREEAEGMYELESSEEDESSSEEDIARADRIEWNAIRLDADDVDTRPVFRPDDRWAWSHERPMSLHGP